MTVTSDRRIYKYTVEVNEAGGAQHAIPRGSMLLDVQLQDGALSMWWSVPVAELDEPSRWPLRSFVIVGTGHSFPPGLHYMATIQISPYVWHLFSVEEFQRA